MKPKYNIGDKVFYNDNGKWKKAFVQGVVPLLDIERRLPEGWVRGNMNREQKKIWSMMPQENIQIKTIITGYKYIILDMMNSVHLYCNRWLNKNHLNLVEFHLESELLTTKPKHNEGKRFNKTT